MDKNKRNALRTRIAKGEKVSEKEKHELADAVVAEVDSFADKLSAWEKAHDGECQADFSEEARSTMAMVLARLTANTLLAVLGGDALVEAGIMLVRLGYYLGRTHQPKA